MTALGKRFGQAVDRVLAAVGILVVNFGLCGEAEFEAGQGAGSSSVQWCAVPERFEAQQVEGAGHVDVVEAGFWESPGVGGGGGPGGGLWGWGVSPPAAGGVAVWRAGVGFARR